MFRSKVTFADWQTPEQRAGTVRHARREDNERRAFNNMMGFWRICAKPKCRRARTCADDMHACFKRHWPIVPEENKEYVRGCIKAAQHARSPEAIHRAGLAAVARYWQTLERTAAPPAAQAPAPIAEPDDAASPELEARIRRL